MFGYKLHLGSNMRSEGVWFPPPYFFSTRLVSVRNADLKQWILPYVNAFFISRVRQFKTMVTSNVVWQRWLAGYLCERDSQVSLLALIVMAHCRLYSFSVGVAWGEGFGVGQRSELRWLLLFLRWNALPLPPMVPPLPPLNGFAVGTDAFAIADFSIMCLLPHHLQRHHPHLHHHRSLPHHCQHRYCIVTITTLSQCRHLFAPDNTHTHTYGHSHMHTHIHKHTSTLTLCRFSSLSYPVMFG